MGSASSGGLEKHMLHDPARGQHLHLLVVIGGTEMDCYGSWKKLQLNGVILESLEVGALSPKILVEDFLCQCTHQTQRYLLGFVLHFYSWTVS